MEQNTTIFQFLPGDENNKPDTKIIDKNDGDNFLFLPYFPIL